MSKKKSRKNKYIKIGNLRVEKKIVIIVICVAVPIIGFIAFRTSYLWPWPSQSEIDQRLLDVVDACMYNENSRACKNLQNRYSMSFEYCYALSDIPEIGVDMPIYGVAKKNSYVAPPLTHISMTKGRGPTSSSSASDDIKTINSGVPLRVGKRADSDSKYPYYGCIGSLDEIKEQKGVNLIAEPETIALFGLSKVAEYSVSGDNINGCSAGWSSFNNLWNQIPNAQAIKNEGDNIRGVYNKCRMIADAKVAANKLNDKLKAYANSYSVQLFYQKYDEWATIEYSGCTWYDKHFDQLCGAASDGKSDSAGSEVMLKDFTSEMYEYLHTKYFTSKIVVTD